MGMWGRVVIAAVVSCGLGAALWAILQIGADVDPAIAAGAAAGLAAVLGCLFAVWVGQPPADSARRANSRSAPNTGTLKAVSRTFTDRRDEWASILGRVRTAKSLNQVREAFMIYGMPGVGKTEFAQYAAHQLVAEFTHYARRAGLDLVPRLVELHGLEGVARTDPRDALHHLLDLQGPDLRRATMNLDDLSAEWRNYLQGKFLILVLDNADSEDQVLPFLPGGSSFILLVTGRRMLLGLSVTGVTPCPLKELPEDGAVQLVRNIVRLPGNVDQQAIEEIVRMFGYHPKAITLAVAKLAWRPGASLAGRLAELKKHPNLLLAADEYADKGSGGVARSFDLSYTQLPDAAKLVLRRISLAPVPAVSVEAAVALADLPDDVVTASLRELTEESLIEEDGARESYQMHDLVRHYSRSLANRDDPMEGEAAVSRLLAYYCEATAYADTLFTRQPPPRAIEPPVPSVSHHFADRPSVIKWVRAELPNLLACADYVVQQSEGNDWREENSWVVLFSCALSGILRNEGQWRRSIEFQAQAIGSAEKIHVPLAVANALSERGLLYRLTADLELAVADLERAISIYRGVGGTAGQTGEAHALNTYGVVLDQLRKRDEGRQRLNEALYLHRKVGDPLGEANVLHDLGMAEFFAGNHDLAVGLLRQGLEAYQAVDHPLGMAHAHTSLARAEAQTGAQSAAAGNLEAARGLYRDLGNRLGEINVMVRLGAVLRQQDGGRAVAVLHEALALSTEIGNQLARINALDELGEVHAAKRDKKAAADAWSRALAVAREHGVEREVEKLAAKIERVR
jgi:tetratricopeptide (TPR) repeat protein